MRRSSGCLMEACWIKMDARLLRPLMPPRGSWGSVGLPPRRPRSLRVAGGNGADLGVELVVGLEILKRNFFWRRLILIERLMCFFSLISRLFRRWRHRLLPGRASSNCLFPDHRSVGALWWNTCSDLDCDEYYFAILVCFSCKFFLIRKLIILLPHSIYTIFKRITTLSKICIFALKGCDYKYILKCLLVSNFSYGVIHLVNWRKVTTKKTFQFCSFLE